MMKFLKYIVFTIACGVVFSSCTFEEENLFEDTAAIRMEKTIESYKTLLCSASNGWVMEYFPTDTTEGYTFLMKFDKSMKVVMATRNKWVGNAYTTDSCVFDLLSDDGPVLSFPMAGTYKVNGKQVGIFHLFANPESPNGTSDFSGYGLQGDYEFVVVKATETEMILKGKKRSTVVYLKKLADDQSWTGYFDAVQTMTNLLVSSVKDPLTLQVGSSLYTVSTNMSSYGSYANKYRIYPSGGDLLLDGTDVAYLVTPTGLRFHTPFTAGETSVQTFVLDDAKQQLNCTDENAEAAIYNTKANTYFIEKLNDSYAWQISLDAQDMSDTVNTVVNRCKASLTAAGRTLTSLSFKYDSDRAKNELRVVFKSTTATVTANFDYTISPLTDGLTVSYLGTYDNNGSLLYTKFDGYSSLVQLLHSSYSLTSVSGLNISKLKLTSLTNPDIWFYVERN